MILLSNLMDFAFVKRSKLLIYLVNISCLIDNEKMFKFVSK